MKKRTVKDFVALYAPEDEEKLVLIQDGRASFWSISPCRASRIPRRAM